MSDAQVETGSAPSLTAAWALGRLECLNLGLNREPTPEEIAARIAGSPDLRFIAGLHEAPVSAARVLKLWRAGR